MPAVVRIIENLFPMTYFVPIARGIITKGIGFSVLSGQVLALVLYLVVVIFLAAISFRKRLD